MTTIAFDGITMAADSLSVDSWGLRDYLDKIWSNEYVVIGCAGESGHIRAWLRTLGKGTLVSDLLRDGYLHWHKDDNNPTIMVVDRATKALYKSTHGHFIPTTYKFHAAGSGQDFARTAMHLGKTAREAVEIAIVFDNNSGGDIMEVKL